MSAEHADREAGSIPIIPSTYQWPTAVRVLDLQPEFRIGEFLRGDRDGRQTIGRGSTRGGSAGMSRKLAAAWPPPEIVRPPTEYLMITNERQKTTHCCQFAHDPGWSAVDPKRPFIWRKVLPLPLE